ncbi:MAG TPA: NUDIX domain-containing protein [Terriglobia bacterium]|nr:NUDIX domain-containing protein [Terriglobia bacterium]
MLIRNGDRLLAIRRPNDDDELPGIWGLPAGSCRGAETVEDVIRRIGRTKLGVVLQPLRKVTFGAQDRLSYRLEMELWEATMGGTPTYPEWQWAKYQILGHGAAKGSLCCSLALETKGRVG